MAERALTDNFMTALEHIESSRHFEPMRDLFSTGAELANLAGKEHGRDAALRFWTRYRDQFAEIKSTFSKIIESDNGAVLTWQSDGRLANGQSISYKGASILTYDGDRIAHFETYYDSAAFLQTGPARATIAKGKTSTADADGCI